MIRNLVFIICIFIFFGMTSMTLKGFAQQQLTTNCYPQSLPCWTGSCTSSLKTDSCLVYGISQYGKRGWMKFDISGIPDNAIISQVILHYNIINYNNLYYRFTKLAIDPVTTAAQNIYAVIGQANSGQSPNTYFDYYIGNSQTGNQTATLNEYAVADIQTSLLNDYFSVGVYGYKTSSSYYICINGWNYPAQPWLEVSYSLSNFQNDIGVKSITSPYYYINSGIQPVKAEIKNYGLNTIYSAQINWEVNGAVQPTYYFNDTLTPGATMEITAGNFNFCDSISVVTISASMPNNVQDADTANNNKTLTVNVYTPPVYCQLDSVYGCPADTLDIRMRVHNFNNIASFKLYIKYDTTKLDYLYYSGINTNLPCPSNFTITEAADTLVLTYNCTQAAGFSYIDFIHLYFHPIDNGCNIPLSFINTSNISSAFYNTAGILQTSYFSNSDICIMPLPGPAGPISGPVVVCPGQSAVAFSVPETENAIWYNWSLPTGAYITGGYYTDTILVSFHSNAVGGAISVYGFNYCGEGASSSLQIAIAPKPGAAGTITGPATVCPGQGIVTYSVPAIANALSYIWVLPAGVSGTSFGNSINLSFNNNFSGGNIYVYGINNCDSGQASYLHISECLLQDSLIFYLPTITGCKGPLHYPVICDNAAGLASISLGIIYDSLHLSFQGYSNTFPGLSGGFIAVNNNGPVIQIGWFSVTPVNMESDTLLYLDFIADTGWSALSFDLQTPGLCYQTDINNNPLSALYFNGSVYTGSCAEINGIITYENSISSPISNTQITLINNQYNVYSTQSDAAGNYAFGSVYNGSYQLGASVNKPSGGINAIDALNVLKHFVNISPLTGIKLQAADVDGTGFVNSSDGLMIAKRFVQMISTFPVGDWLVPEVTVNALSNASITSNLKAICYGDVDGSFVPAIKQNPSIELEGNGQEIAIKDGTFSIPLISAQDAEAEAISLILHIEDNDLILLDIQCPFDGNLVYNQCGNEIRIAWYSLKKMNIKAGENMMVLNFINKRTEYTPNDITLRIYADGESNVYNTNTTMPEWFRLFYPDRFYTGKAVFSVVPNPVSDECRVSFSLDNASGYSMCLYDSHGQILWQNISPEIPEGQYNTSLDLSNFSPGMYMLVLKDNSGIRRCKIIRE